jgi:hypothetical protein
MVDCGPAGLCATCAHVRLVQSNRGAVFYMCEESERDPSLRKYPVIPVRVCAAHCEVPSEPGLVAGAGTGDGNHHD